MIEKYSKIKGHRRVKSSSEYDFHKLKKQAENIQSEMNIDNLNSNNLQNLKIPEQLEIDITSKALMENKSKHGFKHLIIEDLEDVSKYENNLIVLQFGKKNYLNELSKSFLENFAQNQLKNNEENIKIIRNSEPEENQGKCFLIEEEDENLDDKSSQKKSGKNISSTPKKQINKKILFNFNPPVQKRKISHFKNKSSDLDNNVNSFMQKINPKFQSSVKVHNFIKKEKTLNNDYNNNINNNNINNTPKKSEILNNENDKINNLENEVKILKEKNKKLEEINNGLKFKIKEINEKQINIVKDFNKRINDLEISSQNNNRTNKKFEEFLNNFHHQISLRFHLIIF